MTKFEQTDSVLSLPENVKTFSFNIVIFNLFMSIVIGVFETSKIP